jgi:uncharacterized protein
MKIIIAGCTGYLGTVLTQHYQRTAHTVIGLTRHPTQPHEIQWDGENQGPWAHHLEAADLIINLSGHTVNCRYNAKNRRILHHSRIAPTQALAHAINACCRPPQLWLNASTATIYRHNHGTPWTEEDHDFSPHPDAKDAYSVQLALDWEQAFFDAPVPSTVRRLALRTAMVLGHGENSVYPTLSRLTRYFLGGSMGSGQQKVSWIHEQDFIRAIDFITHTHALTGPVNLASPHPITNAEMMSAFRSIHHRPFGLPATPLMLEVGAYLLRTETELILKSRNVAPAKLLAAGFDFHYPSLHSALRQLCQ